MIIMSAQNKRRKLYAEQIEGTDEFILSVFPDVGSGSYRPVMRLNSRQEVEQEAMQRGCEVVWSTS